MRDAGVVGNNEKKLSAALQRADQARTLPLQDSDDLPGGFGKPAVS